MVVAAYAATLPPPAYRTTLPTRHSTCLGGDGLLGVPLPTRLHNEIAKTKRPNIGANMKPRRTRCVRVVTST